MPDRMGKTRSECFRGGTFFILTFFKLILKLTSGKHYLHPVTLGRAWRRGAAGLLCRATCSGAAGVPRWLAVARGADVGMGLPRHMHRRGRLAAPPRMARQRQAYKRGPAPFLPPPPFLPLPEPTCISRRSCRPAHPQIWRFVVGIVWEIDPRILGKALPLFSLSFST
jgi:hypothetical protein